MYTNLQRLEVTARASSAALGGGFVSKPHIPNRSAKVILLKIQLTLQVSGSGGTVTLCTSTPPYASVALTLDFFSSIGVRGVRVLRH